MDKDMASAYKPKLQGDVKRLTGTGIKLRVTEKDTGKEVSYGVQLNNTTLEIEALPNLTVDIKGYRAMYEALKNIWASTAPKCHDGYIKFINDAAGDALAQAEGK